MNLLPVELIENILNNCDYDTIIRLHNTNKKFHYISAYIIKKYRKYYRSLILNENNKNKKYNAGMSLYIYSSSINESCSIVHKLYHGNNLNFNINVSRQHIKNIIDDIKKFLKKIYIDDEIIFVNNTFILENYVRTYV